jgi:LysM repeat protein
MLRGRSAWQTSGSIRISNLDLNKGWNFAWLALLVASLSLATQLVQVRSIPLSQPQQIWLNKPVLGYLALSDSLVGSMQAQVGLSTEKTELIQAIAALENQRLQELLAESREIINDPVLSMEEKSSLIRQAKYNERMDAILLETDALLRKGLDGKRYEQLRHWIEWRWQKQQQEHGLAVWQNSVKLGPEYTPRSYKIYATHYKSKGAYTVALPDKCVKFANAGRVLSDCTGYEASPGGYTVIMSYQKSTGVNVGEAGPWNIDDTFWASTTDPTPRRLFIDLPVGMPAAQAAYFDGYNGGVDQYGRKVTGPYAIDLGEGVGEDIGLKWGKSDWIMVSFMWTDGWGKAKKDKNESAVTAQPATTIVPLSQATARADGSIVHIVQPGQALWNIAAIYEISLDELLALNNLTRDSFINPGDELIIRMALAIATETATTTASITPMKPSPTTSSSPTANPSPTFTFTPTATLTLQRGPTVGFMLGDPWLVGILSFVALGILLMLVGLFAGRR